MMTLSFISGKKAQSLAKHLSHKSSSLSFLMKIEKYLILRLEILSAEDGDSGEYSCRVKNQYGVLEKKIVLEVEDLEDGYGEEEKALEMKRELHGIFKKQMRIYSALARCANQYGASNIVF